MWVWVLAPGMNVAFGDVGVMPGYVMMAICGAR